MTHSEAASEVWSDRGHPEAGLSDTLDWARDEFSQSRMENPMVSSDSDYGFVHGEERCGLSEVELGRGRGTRGTAGALPASTTLTMDEDEPIYLSASIDAAEAIRDRDWARLSNPRLNPEHPGLVKALNGVVIAQSPSPQDKISGLVAVRGLSVMAGLMAVGLAAAVHPLAGIALATHTIHAKHSSQGHPRACLCSEALAMLLAWRHRGTKRDHVWWLVGGPGRSAGR